MIFPGEGEEDIEPNKEVACFLESQYTGNWEMPAKMESDGRQYWKHINWKCTWGGLTGLTTNHPPNLGAEC